jgi:hypothetical protein
VRLLLEAIRSPRFIEEVRAMGGYEVEDTGKLVADVEP